MDYCDLAISAYQNYGSYDQNNHLNMAMLFWLSCHEFKGIFKALAVLLVGIILSSGFVAILSDWLKPMPSIDVKSLVDDSTPMWLFALLVLICAPIYEELICRGLFWRLGEDILAPFSPKSDTQISLLAYYPAVFFFCIFNTTILTL